MGEIFFKKLKGLEYFDRIDAEFYSPFYSKIYETLSKLKKKYEVKELPELIICPVRTGATPKEQEREPLNDGTDVLFVKTDSVRKGFINYNVADLLPLKAHKKRKLTSLRCGDIVVTVVGATHEIIGRAGLYLRDEPANINQSDALIRVDENKIEAGYLSTFINSKYGRMQLWKYSGQTEQVTMNCREVEKLLVPLLPKDFREKIHTSVIESEKLREESDRVYQQSQQLLLKVLEVNELDMKQNLTFTFNFSEMQKEKRIDAEFHQPKIRALLHFLIDKFNARQLGVEFPNIITGQYIDEYAESGKPFIRGTDIQNGTIDDSNLFFVSGNLQKLSKKAKEGDVVVVRVGSIGIAGRIPKELEGSTISDNLLRIRIERKDVNNYYIVAFLSSTIGQELMKVFSRGSVQQRLNQETLKCIPIPIIKEAKQREISELLNESHQLREKSKNLLEGAKLKVESFIEKETA